MKLFLTTASPKHLTPNYVMFIGREKEIRTLDKLYHSDKFEFAVIYGRRRVGKTALISEFAKNKDTIFFTGIDSLSIEENIKTLILHWVL